MTRTAGLASGLLVLACAPFAARTNRWVFLFMAAPIRMRGGLGISDQPQQVVVNDCSSAADNSQWRWFDAQGV